MYRYLLLLSSRPAGKDKGTSVFRSPRDRGGWFVIRFPRQTSVINRAEGCQARSYLPVFRSSPPLAGTSLYRLVNRGRHVWTTCLGSLCDRATVGRWTFELYVVSDCRPRHGCMVRRRAVDALARLTCGADMFSSSAPNTCRPWTNGPRRHSKTSCSTCPVAYGLL